MPNALEVYDSQTENFLARSEEDALERTAATLSWRTVFAVIEASEGLSVSVRRWCRMRLDPCCTSWTIWMVVSWSLCRKKLETHRGKGMVYIPKEDDAV
jgi:hypothetical protein